VIHSIGADSEVGCLRTVLVHRPGAEMKRITPRTTSRLRIDRVPWLARAQQEHDALTRELRSRGVEVLLVTELLRDVLEYACARDEVIGLVVSGAALGHELGFEVRDHLESLQPEDLAAALVAGLTPAELRAGRGLVYELLGPHDFIIDPLPNLVFSRDSSLWIGDQVVITGLPGPRAAENMLLSAIYRHHPRFAGLKEPYHAGADLLDGGDVIQLAPGVVAVGVGTRTSPVSVERLARHLLDTGAVHAVLAVPMGQRHQIGCLDLACTVVDSDAVVMVPAVAFTLTALAITARAGALAVSRPRPFLEAAARAMGIGKLTVIGTGIDPPGWAAGLPILPGVVPADLAGQWDDGANALVVGHRVIVCDERNVETNARLAVAGYHVVTVPASELGGLGSRGGRRGPRCMCAPIRRDPAPAPRPDAAAAVGRPGSLAALANAGPPPNVSAELVSAQPQRPQDAAPVGLPLRSAPRPAADPEYAEGEQRGEHDPEADHERVQEHREQHPREQEDHDRHDDVHDGARHVPTVREHNAR
jgi:arginine deiminase